MMNFLARNRRDNRLAHLAPLQGVRLIGSFPGVKTPGRVLLPLRGREPTPKILKLALIGGCRAKDILFRGQDAS